MSPQARYLRVRPDASMMPPIPILFTIPNFITAGSGGAMLNIVERIDRSRYAPAICVMRKGGKLDRKVEQLGIPFIEAPFTVPAKPYRTLFQRAWQAAQVFKSYRFRLWHSFNYADDYTEPIIARFATARHWVYTKKNMSWGSRAWHVRTILSSGVVVQNTDMMRDFFTPTFYRRKARLVPRGVVTEYFRPAALPRSELVEVLGLPADAVVVACVAHLVRVKGHPTLLKAISDLPNVHVIIAGKPLEDSYVAELHRLSKMLDVADRVHFIGNVTDVPTLLHGVDLFVLPTWERWRMEGCPVSLLEALACGKACIATDIPGSRDIIENGVSGLLVPAEDAVVLGNAISGLASDKCLRERLGSAARARVTENYTIQREVADHIAFYDKVLDTR